MSDRGSAPPAWLRRSTLEIALVLIAVGAGAWVVYRLRSLLFSIAIAVFISIALEPAVQYLTKRGWSRQRASTVVFFGSMILAVGFVVSLVPLLVSQGSAIVRNLPGYLEDLSAFLGERGMDVDFLNAQVEAQLENTSELLGRFGSSIASVLFSVGNTVFGAVFNLFTIALFAYFALAQAPQLRATLLRFLRPDQQRELLRIWEIAIAKTGGYIYSRLILAVISAAITSVALALLGVPFAIALGMWVGVLSQFVPVVGAYIAAVLPVTVALVADPIDAVWVLVLLIGYQQVENLIIAPRITARAMSLHPAVAVGSVLAGASLFGGIGAVLALPVAATVQAFVATAIERYDLIDSDLLPETGERRP